MNRVHADPTGAGVRSAPARNGRRCAARSRVQGGRQPAAPAGAAPGRGELGAHNRERDGDELDAAGGYSNRGEDEPDDDSDRCGANGQDRLSGARSVTATARA